VQQTPERARGSSVADRQSAASIYAVEIGDLPVVTAVITATLAAGGDDDATVKRLTEVALADPCFASKVLAAAQASLGSAAGPAGIVTACRMLGARGLRAIVEPVDRMKIFIPSSEAQKHLWLHSLQVAALSEALAETLTSSEVTPETAYTTGLLHDIGRFLTYYWRNDLPEAVEAEGTPTPEDVLDAEMNHAPVDHAYLGALALAQWGFAGPVQHVVANHHRVLAATDLYDPIQQLLAIVRLADLVSVCLMNAAGQDEDTVERQITEQLAFNPIAVGSEQPSAEVVVDLARFIEREADRRYAALRLGPSRS